jgi:hypothetical protein
MVFAVPPGFVACVSATSRTDLSQFGLFTVARRLSLLGPIRSFSQRLQGDLHRSTGRGSHCPPIAFPARAGYLSLSQQLQGRVYLRVTDDRNCAVDVLALKPCLIACFEGWRVFGLRFALIVDSGGGDGGLPNSPPDEECLTRRRSQIRVHWPVPQAGATVFPVDLLPDQRTV